MAITKVSPALIQVANNVTSTTIGNTTSIPSLTFDASGVIIAASNTTVTVANTNITGNIISSQITSVANTQLTGTVTNAQVGSSVYEGMGMRNRIINGDMRIDQRNAGAAVTPVNNGYTLDRWKSGLTQSSKFTAQQDSSANTVAGFTSSIKITSSSAYSVTTGDTFFFDQIIEGFNTADLNWGTANAKTVTLSFWVRSSLTGQFGGAFRNSAADRAYPFSYTISAANTWEQKSITVAGDTSGTWIGATNGTGIELVFDLGSGSTYLATAGTWASGNYIGATGDSSVVGTNGATWYITGVQLEVGSVATPFERRPFGTELSLCQRYYLPVPSGMAYGRGNGPSGTVCSLPIPVPLRATPTLPSTTTSAHLYSVSGYSGAVTATWSDITLVSNSVKFQGAGFSGGTDNRPNLTEVGSGFYFSAEL
jgi:hypothetical protein